MEWGGVGLRGGMGCGEDGVRQGWMGGLSEGDAVWWGGAGWNGDGEMVWW